MGSIIWGLTRSLRSFLLGLHLTVNRLLKQVSLFNHTISLISRLLSGSVRGTFLQDILGTLGSPTYGSYSLISSSYDFQRSAV
jgi:hypothetical protein